MTPLRILITNNTLAFRAGSELYARDVAVALRARGHLPILYSTVLGDVADEVRRATIPVVDRLDAIAATPDVIHGQHHLEAMTAMLHFPTTPAIYVCHGWLPWEEAPPPLPRIWKYVAVDRTVADRLQFEHGIGNDRLRLLLNFVDLDRFPQRDPLPPRPRRALIFSNAASHHSDDMPIIREACARFGIDVDIAGEASGRVSPDPGSILRQYDFVFARGRSALEAMASGCAVLVWASMHIGELVTSANFDRLRPLNFGIRALTNKLTVDGLAREIALYDSADASAVTSRVRAEAGIDCVVDQLIALYREAIEHSAAVKVDRVVESRAVAEYLRWITPVFKQRAEKTAPSE